MRKAKCLCKPGQQDPCLFASTTGILSAKKKPCFEYLMTWRTVVNMASKNYIVSETFESSLESACKLLYLALWAAFPELFPSVHDAAEALVSFCGWCKLGVSEAKNVNVLIALFLCSSTSASTSI